MSAHRHERGFTLVEILVGLALFGLTIGSILWVFTNEVKSSTVTGRFVETQQGGRLALELIMEETRWADGIVSASTTPAGFSVHIPAPNPLMGNQDYQVSYSLLADGTLQRTVTPTGGAPVTSNVAGHVTALTTNFYDNGNPPNVVPATSAATAYQVELVLTLTVGQQFRTFTSLVSLRNKT